MAVSLSPNRPRNVDWRRAAALLYGDWGTSKAYVIGLAFAAAQFSSFPIVIAVCLLTAFVGYNYVIVCRNFPDGGGVYSAARQQSRLLAAVGALLLIANFIVTASLSGWAAMSYFGVPQHLIPYATMGTILLLGVVNYFGPKHSGSMAVGMAIPTVLCVVAILAFSIPYLSTQNLQWPVGGFSAAWVKFAQVILALSGVEAIASMTGVMKLDRNSTSEKPRVVRTASMALLVVAIEVVLGTVLLGWATLSIAPSLTPDLLLHKEDMLRYLGEHFAGMHLGSAIGGLFGWVVGIVFGILLVSAVNTAIMAVIGVIYMMALDGEFPRPLTKLNSHGVPTLPLAVGTILPVVVLILTRDFDALASLYAIGVVGAIAVNLGSCSINRRLEMSSVERILMTLTALVLGAVWLTIAYTMEHALFFAICVLGVGLTIRSYSHKVVGLRTVTVSAEAAEIVSDDALARLRPRCEEGQKVMVAARGPTPVLRFALDYAAAKKATLCVLYVKEVAVFMGGAPREGGRPKWQDDPHAAAIMNLCLKLGKEMGVPVLPVYAISSEPASTILDSAATLGVDFLMLGASHRLSLARLLKGNVIEQVAAGLPENIELIIHG